MFLDNAQETRVFTLRPIYYDMTGNVVATSGLNFSTTSLEVTVPVEQLQGFAQKPITVKWEGEPAPGYRLLNVSVEPDNVLVTGRPTGMDLLGRLNTEPIDITGLQETVTEQ